jgi:integrase
MRGKRLSDEGVAKLPAKKTRYAAPDPELRGHYVRVAPTGAKSFWVVARDKNGRQKWVRLGDVDMGIDAARDQAMAQLRLIRSSTDTTATTIVVNTSFEAVVNKWLELHVEQNQLRSERAIRRFVKRHLLPAFSGMDFADVRRRHISELLDRIQKNSGTRTADYTLSIISAVCRWYALRDDDYESPIVPGMNRGGNNARARVLNEAEIATLWKDEDFFGNFTKFALLTAQRVDKIYTMRWEDVVDGVWHIATAPREKGNAGSLRLPQLALDVLEDQRDLNGDLPFVFAGTTGSPKWRFFRDQGRFNARHHFPHWTFHDLRRTARSLMAAAGVPELHAELVMGHVQQGVIGIYDRHTYATEKADALLRLANRIRDIVSPPPENIHKLPSRAA